MLLSFLKTIHIISVISWMAGLLYLPRIFVYHSEKNINKETSSTFKIMERKLYWFIMNPAAILTWISGLAMIHYFGFELWLIIKILFVLSLTVFHFYCGIWLNNFALDKNYHSSKFFRIINEVPTALLILIIIIVVFKPF
tara:strand:- start:146 stop:565 length:420 start_codon:yes stop_codon:yes gene_type:complete